MANYIINNSKFTPFTFQEMVAPLNMYKEAYDKVESDLDSLYSSIGNFNFSTVDDNSNTKRIYDTFNNSILTAEEDLLNNGLGGNTRQKLLELKRVYNTNIKPIEQKIKKRESLIAKQDAIKKANPLVRFDIDYSTQSIDNINDSSTFNSIDLSKVTEEAMREFNELAKQKSINDLGDSINGFVPVTEGYGFNNNELKVGLNTDGSIIKDYYDTKLKSYGAFANNPEVQQAIKSGMQLGSGQTRTTYIVDPKGKNNPNNDPITFIEGGKKYYKSGNTLYEIKENGDLIKVGGNTSNDVIDYWDNDTKQKRKRVTKKVGNRWAVEHYDEDGNFTYLTFEDPQKVRYTDNNTAEWDEGDKTIKRRYNPKTGEVEYEYLSKTTNTVVTKEVYDKNGKLIKKETSNTSKSNGNNVIVQGVTNENTNNPFQK
jgi:hypothetical protein